MSQLKASPVTASTASVAAAAASMSSVASAVASPAPAPGRPQGSRPTAPRPRLTVVPPVRAPVPRAPFVLLVSGLLTGGLVGLLFLHTAIAEDSFRLHDLTARSVVLADRAQALEQEIAMAAAPQRLAVRAGALGMVRSENPVFIRTSDGRILGKPKAGVAPPVRVTRAPQPTSSKPTKPAKPADSTKPAKPAPSPTATR